MWYIYQTTVNYVLIRPLVSKSIFSKPRFVDISMSPIGLSFSRRIILDFDVDELIHNSR